MGSRKQARSSALSTSPCPGKTHLLSWGALFLSVGALSCRPAIAQGPPAPASDPPDAPHSESSAPTSKSAPSQCTDSPPDQSSKAVESFSAGTSSAASGELELPQRDLCVVLSVGAEQGLAHIGVLTALRERGILPGCIVGNSMGALVGGLYASDPQTDLAASYRGLFSEYEQKSRSDAGPLGVRALLGFNTQDWSRLRAVLGATMGNARIENLPVSFVTEHQEATASGIQRNPVRGGVLADEVARSIANPFLFSDIKMQQGVPLDPGADRVSAVPLQLACEQFPSKRFIVSNVTGEDLFISSQARCPYQEIRIKPQRVDASLAIRGKEPDFRRLIASGYSEALKSLDWKQLAASTQAKSREVKAPLEYLRVTLEVSLPTEKAPGETWDAPGAALPEPWITTEVQACAGCDAFSTSAGSSFSAEASDSLKLTQDLGVLALRRGFKLGLRLRDRDISQHDEVARFTLLYDKPGSYLLSSQGGASVRITLTPLP